MKWPWLFAVLGIVEGLSACTLTEEDFNPVEVDSNPMAPGSPALPSVDCARTCESAAGRHAPAAPASVAPANPGEAQPTLPLQAPMPPTTPSSSAMPDPMPAPMPAESPPAAPEIPADEGAPTAPAAPTAAPAPGPALDPDLQLIGWASVEGLGTPTTTGGAAGATVVATSAEQLDDFASRAEPLTILIVGTLRLPRVSVASDKTLRGVGPLPRIEGGLRIRGKADAFVSNVIVQNLEIDASFSDVEGDGVQIHYAHHVWVDHCDVHDAEDGNLDVVHGSDFVTVSWTRFAFGADAGGARFSSQIGHSDSGAAEDTGHLRVTLHHNLWDAGVRGSMPSARFGDVHAFNSYYASPDAETAITAALGSRLLIEGNFFESVPTPYQISGGTDPEPELRAVGNIVSAPAPTLETAGVAFVPPYEYALEEAAGVPERVRSAAGATLSFAVPDP